MAAESIRWYDLIDAAERFERSVLDDEVRPTRAEVEAGLWALQRQRDAALRARGPDENTWLRPAPRRRLAISR
jgi:hypothetical protein